MVKCLKDSPRTSYLVCGSKKTSDRVTKAVSSCIAALSTLKKISNMAPLALTFKEASLKVLTCRPSAVLEASREKTPGTQDSKEQKRLSLQSFFNRRSMEDEPFLKKKMIENIEDIYALLLRGWTSVRILSD